MNLKSATPFLLGAFLLGAWSVTGLERIRSRGNVANGIGLGPGGITFPDGSVQATAAPGRRGFYLTNDSFAPTGALAACAPGYHMASLWEILDPTDLRYETSLGSTTSDAGAGPNSLYPGWIRTGFYSASGIQVGYGGGTTNCNTWTIDADAESSGTVVQLNPCWQQEAGCVSGNAAPWWIATEVTCTESFRVWCVAD